MPTASHPPPEEPLRVSILTQGSYLIASIHTALDDGQLVRFRRDLLEQIGRHRSRGVIIDVAALDVIDSFACHTLRTITEVARLRGAETVVVGIQPDVALAMVRLGVSRREPDDRARPRGGAGAARGHHVRRGVPPREGRRPVTGDARPPAPELQRRVPALPQPPRRAHPAHGLRARPPRPRHRREPARPRPDPPRRARGRAARPAGARRAAGHRRRGGRVPGRGPRAVRDDPPRRSRPHWWRRRREPAAPAVLRSARPRPHHLPVPRASPPRRCRTRTGGATDERLHGPVP